MSVSSFVILQECGELAPRSVACSTIAKHHGALGLVVSSEFEAFSGQFCKMIFSIAGFDLNGPMGDWICTKLDGPRQDSHCGLIEVFSHFFCVSLACLIETMYDAQSRSSGFQRSCSKRQRMSCGWLAAAAGSVAAARKAQVCVVQHRPQSGAEGPQSVSPTPRYWVTDKKCGKGDEKSNSAF